MLVSFSPAINTHFCCPSMHTQKAMLTLAPPQSHREGNKPVWKVSFQVDEAGNPGRSLRLLIGGRLAFWSSQGLFFCSTMWKVRCDTIAGSDDLAYLLYSEHNPRPRFDLAVCEVFVPEWQAGINCPVAFWIYAHLLQLVKWLTKPFHCRIVSLR